MNNDRQKRNRVREDLQFSSGRSLGSKFTESQEYSEENWTVRYWFSPLTRMGYTMSELIIVMIILAILFVGMTTTYNVHVKNSRIDTVEGNLVIFKSDIEAYLEDYGVFNVQSDATAAYKNERILAFLNKLSTDYLHLTFDMDTLHIAQGSFYVDTVTLDPWKAPFRMFYNTDPKSATVGTCILSSAGPNLGFTSDTYPVGDFGDDILVTIVPKIGVVENP